MTSYLDNLITARDNVAANLVSITSEPKPTYSIDGQMVSWTQLFTSYMDQLEQLDARIAAADPFEIQSRGYTDP